MLYANIMMGEGNSIGRGGLGAIMGRKSLKAVIVSGGEEVAIADRRAFRPCPPDVMRLFRASPVIFGELGIAEYGTPALVDLMAPSGGWRPRRTFQIDRLRKIRQLFRPRHRRSAAPRKMAATAARSSARKVRRKGEPLPEYETVNHFGALNGISELTPSFKANTLCNELGLDTISAAATASAWGEARGRFPDAPEVPDSLGDIAYRRGEGNCSHWVPVGPWRNWGDRNSP